MVLGNWNEIENKIKLKIRQIFKEYDIEKLSLYEKRKIIFEYLCSSLKYDYDLLEKIKENEARIILLKREPYMELENVINNGVGICNAISQYYKLLLEQIGIKSYCVICDDGTKINHQLNLVYDDENNSYSFDDITSVIVGRGAKEDFFDYDTEFANKYNQGNKSVLEEECWAILPEDYINFLVGRLSSLSYNIDKLPSNIKSLKNNIGIKF